ncbi:penicillin-binding protein [Lysinibacillus sphaericus]|uniref:serine-type D-Ala-D-Ala carboxypeptidase n=1 Tax=Lysinibacillus sphaericus TaxID=1421 RepID=A0A544UX79_LYSSH|nr:penicillin-binding protein [Lysinibacillus sp. SDF0037]TQR38403.1 penicillin-binding protein [Lysinibacillus sp. SDF0037]
MKKKRFRFQWGAFLLLIFYGGLFFLLFSRMFMLQVTGEVEGQELAARAAAKYSKESAISASRGKIYDTNGQVIAEDTLSYRLIAVVNEQATTDEKKPRHVVDAEKTAKILAEYIPMDEEKIYKQLTRVNKGKKPYQVEFGSAGRGLSHDTMSKIKAEKLPGIVFINDLKRYYPNGIFASHLIGFALKEDNKDGTFTTKGKMGLELTYNKELTGKDGKVEYETDAFHYLLPSSEKMVTPAKNGDDIYLTLDKTIQSFLEEAMTAVEKEYNPESMTAIVANPKTGKILGMSQRPTFNPDTREGNNMKWLNEAIEETIEPGSTMKTFTLASAIDTGAWDPNAWYKSGTYMVFGKPIRDHNNGIGWGPIQFLEGFQRSSNTAMAHLLKRIGNDVFFDYLDRFGFGKKTGIDLPNEASGTLLSKYPIERVTTTFGQGSTVTPIQLIQAMTAIANDGKMMQPYVIDRIVDPSTGKTMKKHEPIVKGQPVSADTAKQVKEILASTLTAKNGTAKDFILDEYEVAGKTGTAQIPLGNGNYSWGANEFLYSFLGMAPADNPQLIMYVSVKRPKLKNELGSVPVSKIFNPVMLNSLKYLNVNPEDVKHVDETTIQDYTGQSAEAIQVELANDGLKPVIVGSGGKIIDQYPKGPQKLVKGNFVFLKTEGKITLPDFTNWSLRNVLAFKTMANLEIEVVGEGFVASQSVSAGTVISDSSPIVVKLKTPAESFKQDVETPPEGETTE